MKIIKLINSIIEFKSSRYQSTVLSQSIQRRSKRAEILQLRLSPLLLLFLTSSCSNDAHSLPISTIQLLQPPLVVWTNLIIINCNVLFLELAAVFSWFRERPIDGVWGSLWRLFCFLHAGGSAWWGRVPLALVQVMQLDFALGAHCWHNLFRSHSKSMLIIIGQSCVRELPWSLPIDLTYIGIWISQAAFEILAKAPWSFGL